MMTIYQFLTVLNVKNPYCPIQKQRQCFASQVTKEPKFLPTIQCQFPLYLRLSQSLRWEAIYWIVCIFSSPCLEIAMISAYISGLMSLPLTTGLNSLPYPICGKFQILKYKYLIYLNCILYHPMINLIEINKCLETEVNKNKEIFRNIFLTNGENDVLATGNKNKQEVAVLSTILNDSVYIIGFNLFGQQTPRQGTKPIQVCLSVDQQQIFMFSIKNQFIIGFIVDQKYRDIGHKMSVEFSKYMYSQLDNVADWVENTDIF